MRPSRIAAGDRQRSARDNVNLRRERCMTAELITDPRALADLFNALAGSDWLAVDTEFLLERTYRARLCLVHVANREPVGCIAPLAIDQLDPLIRLLHTTPIVKVLHAARQDLEVSHDL